MNLNAWTQPFKGAIEELEKEKLPSYFAKDEIDLERVADEEPWEPHEYILELVPNASTIKVELIDQTSDLHALDQELRRFKKIGLVVLGSTINRHTKPSLIVLTTKEKIYALDPEVPKCIQYLKVKLISREKRHQFYMTNSLYEADCLFGNYGINLSEHKHVLDKIQCCTGHNIHLFQNLLNATDSTLLNVYPLAVRRKLLDDRKVRIEHFETLVELWLDIDRTEIAFDLVKTSHLKTRPLSLTAINIIKKRCLLVLPLAKALEKYHLQEIKVMSNVSFDSLLRCNNDVRESILSERKRSQERGVASLNYLVYADCLDPKVFPNYL